MLHWTLKVAVLTICTMSLPFSPLSEVLSQTRISFEGKTYIEEAGKWFLAAGEEPFVLSSTKIYALNNKCDLLDNFSLGGYRLTVYDDTSQMLFCGYVGISPITTTVTKPVLINGEYGNITLELW